MDKLLSVFGSFVMVTVLSVAISSHYRLDALDTSLWVTVGWFSFGKLAIAMAFTQGYGVKKGVSVVAGMPLILAAPMAVIVTVLALFLNLAYDPSDLHPQTVAKLRAFGWVAASGVATALAHWYFYARQAYFCQSEYNIRMECQTRGDSPEAVQETVIRYRKQGIIR